MVATVVWIGCLAGLSGWHDLVVGIPISGGYSEGGDAPIEAWPGTVARVDRRVARQIGSLRASVPCKPLRCQKLGGDAGSVSVCTRVSPAMPVPQLGAGIFPPQRSTHHQHANQHQPISHQLSNDFLIPVRPSTVRSQPRPNAPVLLLLGSLISCHDGEGFG